ncbi:MAG: hydratase [Clostridia bacterium]|nr:hydratase [Clostridia bacterium]
MLKRFERVSILNGGKNLNGITLIGEKVFLLNGTELKKASECQLDAEAAASGRIADRILAAHDTGDGKQLRVKFDAMTSHDITYVSIIQTARISGLDKFPIPYVLTNCHNSLCAVGGTINEDDHRFGLSAAVKYGGEFVPPHVAVIHQYMRETYAGCGKMILGSDSHTRYGALGTLGVGEGGGELVKQLLGRTYDVAKPEVICVYLKGAPKAGVGPQDVALAIIGAVFENGFVKNRIMEFVGEGVGAMSAEYRFGVDVMTTETTCLSSVWRTDEKIKEYLTAHGRPQDYKRLDPAPAACYDGAIVVDLDRIENMIALPFHPSNVFTIKELNENAADILAAQAESGCDLRPLVKDGRLTARQHIIAGCAGGGYENLAAAADILEALGGNHGELSLYPASQPVYARLMKNGIAERLIAQGAVLKTAFCGPCFGAGDIPANGTLSVRHTTRNFPNREGSKPGEGQSAFVALMDARSIAATAANGGRLTPATELGVPEREYGCEFDASSYDKRVYKGVGAAKPETALEKGPNIADWPEMDDLAENMLFRVACALCDGVTTTDELIPSGETSSYRSNPLRLARFALSRKAPDYVPECERISALTADEIKRDVPQFDPATTRVASMLVAVRPGDGSAREQAASCQRVLGGKANIARKYATKRYRSNLVNWGMLPFEFEDTDSLEKGDYVYIPRVRELVASGAEEIPAAVIRNGERREITLNLPAMTAQERDIILAGCLANYYGKGNA